MMLLVFGRECVGGIICIFDIAIWFTDQTIKALAWNGIDAE